MKFEEKSHYQLYDVDFESKQSSVLTPMLPEASDANLIIQSEERGKTLRILKDSKNEKELYVEVWNENGF